MISRNGIGIGIAQFPDRKRPSLYVQKGNVNIIVASFNSEEGAEYFRENVMRMLDGMIKDGESDGKTKIS